MYQDRNDPGPFWRRAGYSRLTLVWTTAHARAMQARGSNIAEHQFRTRIDLCQARPEAETQGKQERYVYLAAPFARFARKHVRLSLCAKPLPEKNNTNSLVALLFTYLRPQSVSLLMLTLCLTAFIAGRHVVRSASGSANGSAPNVATESRARRSRDRARA